MQKYLHTTWRLWQLLKPFHKHFYIQLFFIILAQILQVASVYIVSQILDKVVQTQFSAAYIFIGLWFLLSVSKIISSYFSDIHSMNKTEFAIQQYLQEYSFKKIFALNPSQYIEEHSAIKLQVIGRGEGAAEAIVRTLSLNIIPTITQILFSIAAIAYFSFPIAFITIITLVVVSVWSNRFANFHRPFVKENIDNWDDQRKIRTEAFQHLNLIKLSASEDSYLKKYLSNRFFYIEHSLKTWTYRINHGHKRWFFFTASRGITTVLLVYYTFLKVLTIGNIYAIWMWINDAYNNIFNVIEAMRDLPLRFIELDKYLAIIDKEPLFDEKGLYDFVPGDIVFENLSFKYPKSESDVLRNISLCIPQGKKVAFVGTSGSGKSTIIKLLLRTYNYTDGNITVSGKRIQDINAQNLRRHIGYVEQHVDLFDTTVRENILFGTQGKEVSEEVLTDIVHKARIDQFYHRLEKGLDTQIGERGVKLSGGERQRIGIARALVKNPEILIFDEATASLDTENEKFIQEAIDEASVGRTSIIIAHRLSTVQNADIIFIMHRGELVGQGTHSELLRDNEYYQTLIKHQ